MLITKLAEEARKVFPFLCVLFIMAFVVAVVVLVIEPRKKKTKKK